MPKASLRQVLKFIPGLASAYWQARILADIAVERYSDPGRRNDLAHMNREWDFERPAERQRHERVLATAAGSYSSKWGDVLEIGCSEGSFTALLARRSRAVTALDVSSVACARAAARCKSYSHVKVDCFDISSEPIMGNYDITFVMDVLSFIHGRRRLERVVRNVADSLRPGGMLVFNETLLPCQFEQTWWARMLAEGGIHLLELLDGRAGLQLVRKLFYEELHGYVIATFRKVGTDGPRRDFCDNSYV